MVIVSGVISSLTGGLVDTLGVTVGVGVGDSDGSGALSS